MKFYIYILYSNNLDKFYIGYSGDPWKRLMEHNTNSLDKFTGKTSDWQLKAVYMTTSKSDAIKIERFIKKQKSRNLILRLIQPEFVGTDMLAQLVRVPHLRD